jgi:hypothetical protein
MATATVVTQGSRKLPQQATHGRALCCSSIDFQKSGGGDGDGGDGDGGDGEGGGADGGGADGGGVAKVVGGPPEVSGEPAREDDGGKDGGSGGGSGGEGSGGKDVVARAAAALWWRR